MTCGQLQEILDREYTHLVTDAEVSATLAHQRNCKHCRDKIRSIAKSQVAQMSPLQLVEQFGSDMPRATRLLQNKECMEILGKR